MILNVRRVKEVTKEYGKQCSKEFLERLDVIVRERIRKASLALPSGVRRLKAIDLL